MEGAQDGSSAPSTMTDVPVAQLQQITNQTGGGARGQQQRGGPNRGRKRGQQWKNQHQHGAQQQSPQQHGGGRRGSPAGGTAAEPVKVPTAQELALFQKEWRPLQYDSVCNADYYFNSYAHFGIHEVMLRDQIRTGTYHRAISQNTHLFKDKVVLDVGSGTGILSLFAARAGAAHVYGVEYSEIVDVARVVSRENGLSDKITYIKGKVEEITLPVEKVDIIISEWMGYFLLFESMLDTVIFARDKWLKPGGLIFPDRASLHLAGIEDAEYQDERGAFWRGVYGFDFSYVKRIEMEEPVVGAVEEVSIATDTCCVLDLDLNTCTTEALDFVAPFKLHLRRRDFIHAVVAWFDVSFSACHKPVWFTTSPHGRHTHWKQTVFYVDDVIVASKDDVLHGIIAVKKYPKNHRELDVKLQYEFNGQYSAKGTQFYRMR